MDIFLEIFINWGLSQEREAIYQKQLEFCNRDLEKELLNFQDALKGNNSPIDLRDQRPGSIGELTSRVYHLGKQNETLQAKIDSEIRYIKFLLQSGVDVGLQKLFEDWLESPFKERRILLHNKIKVGLLIILSSFSGGIPDNVYSPEPGLGWKPVPNNLIPNLFSRTIPIKKYKPRDKIVYKADIDTDHFPYENTCDSCQRIFYTFTKTKQYCCDECERNAYNKRRRNRRHEQSHQLKKPIVKELKYCPICQDEYNGRGRTCGKERCRKAEQRKRGKGNI